MVGTLFILIAFARIIYYHSTRTHLVGFETSIYYWHFVDIIWVILFGVVYYWTGANFLESAAMAGIPFRNFLRGINPTIRNSFFKIFKLFARLKLSYPILFLFLHYIRLGLITIGVIKLGFFIFTLNSAYLKTPIFLLLTFVESFNFLYSEACLHLTMLYPINTAGTSEISKSHINFKNNFQPHGPLNTEDSDDETFDADLETQMGMDVESAANRGVDSLATFLNRWECEPSERAMYMESAIAHIEETSEQGSASRETRIEIVERAFAELDAMDASSSNVPGGSENHSSHNSTSDSQS